MEPTLTWLDLTASDRDRMRRVLDLFGEQGTIDEMGLGSLRDALSDELFPGTSSIQTRLRYMLFVPWTYQILEQRGGGARVAEEARAVELALVSALAQSQDSEGIIGARAREKLTRLPSSVYWAGLVRWGIFVPAQSQSWYHTHFASLVRARGDQPRADDPGLIWTRQPTWNPRLPKAPEGFPGRVDFALSCDEADFLRGRIEERCAGTLLAWMAREGNVSPAMQLWEDATALTAPAPVVALVKLARRFSLHVEGAPLLYNLLLAERRHVRHGHDEALVERYRAELAEWSAREAVEAPFAPDLLWQLVARRGGRLPEPQRQFVVGWATRLAELGAGGVADDPVLRQLVERRELQLKRHLARLANEGRLLDWSGRVGVGRMDFRWFRVRQLLIDLHRGLVS